MKGFYKGIGLLVTCMIWCLNCFSAQTSEELKQQGIKSLKKCSELYLNQKEFSVDVEYAVFYDKDNFSVPDDIETGEVIRKGQLFYQTEAGNTTILNKDYQIRINTFSKVISIADRPEEAKIPTQLKMDSLISSISDVKKIEGGYQFFFAEGAIAQADYFFTSEGYLHKLRNHYREVMNFGEGDVRVVTQIEYKNFKTSIKNVSALFAEESYLKISKSQEVLPLGDYKNYHVLNLIR